MASKLCCKCHILMVFHVIHCYHGNLKPTCLINTPYPEEMFSIFTERNHVRPHIPCFTTDARRTFDIKSAIETNPNTLSGLSCLIIMFCKQKHHNIGIWFPISGYKSLLQKYDSRSNGNTCMSKQWL